MAAPTALPTPAACPTAEAAAGVPRVVHVWVNDGGAPREDITISLTPTEVRLFDTLRATAAAAGTGTTIRVAGGWVRDKLLGRTNEDIDIALDNMAGREFAEHVNAYLRSSGEKTSTVAIVQANPEQSKHLETATTRIYDMWIDIVNLRTEEYGSTSRIPKVAYGTPQQDAERRDFTVNALFYNIATNTIEDFSGKGFSDLREGILRTPIDPMITFVDDPLRVLRAVRFASRLGFQMTPDLRAAAMSPTILNGLNTKVSRERIGNETEQMLSSARPIASLRVLHAFGILPIVFLAPEEAKFVGQLNLPPTMWHVPEDVLLTMLGVSASDAAARSLLASARCSARTTAAATTVVAEGDVPAVWRALSLGMVEAVDYAFHHIPFVHDLRAAAGATVPALPIPALGFLSPVTPAAAPEASHDGTHRVGLSADARRLLTYCAALYPLATLGVMNKKGRRESLLFNMLTDRLRRKHKDGDDVVAVLAAASGFNDLAYGVESGATPAAQQLALGLLIRNTAKEAWPLGLYLALCSNLMSVLLDPAFRGLRADSSAVGVAATAAASQAFTSTLERFTALAHSVHAFDLAGCWSWKPLLNGKMLMDTLGVKGPDVGLFNDQLLRWQLVHPHGSAEAALEHLRAFQRAPTSVAI